MNKKKKIKEIIREYLLLYGHRIEGYASKRRLYNLFEKQAREAENITISLPELKSYRNLHYLTFDLTLSEIQAIINEYITKLWNVTEFRVEVKD